ncbi:MAG: helix-turn-helix domain-containing protein [Candidatus Margulisbacteria bacterium]|jgi:transcriptional regulator with XRE-family HTH domain|nr:helix-turn-helix domain-containing protein [Candidatus Margulisiibacteriota bacterium]
MIINEGRLYQLLGANIKSYRTRSGWSQAELAERVSLSVNFLSDVETGKKWVSPATMLKLAEVFRIEVYELFKPEKTHPDRSQNLLSKYTEDVVSAVQKVRKKYRMVS